MTNDDTCRSCPNGCNAGAVFELATEGVHYGKMVCPKCGRFLDWVRKPNESKQRRRLVPAHKHFAKSGIDYCQMCLRTRDELPPGVAFEAHHVIPVKDGGGDEIENLWHLCSVCHDLIDVVRKYRSRELASR